MDDEAQEVYEQRAIPVSEVAFVLISYCLCIVTLIILRSVIGAFALELFMMIFIVCVVRQLKVEDQEIGKLLALLVIIIWLIDSLRFISIGPLLIVSGSLHDTQTLKLLLFIGSNPNIETFGETPLTIATSIGSYENVKSLLEAHADTNKENSECLTPLMIASERGHTRIVILLLEYRADPLTEDCKGRNSIQIAQMNKHLDIAKILEKHVNNEH